MYWRLIVASLEQKNNVWSVTKCKSKLKYINAIEKANVALYIEGWKTDSSLNNALPYDI